MFYYFLSWIYRPRLNFVQFLFPHSNNIKDIWPYIYAYGIWSNEKQTQTRHLHKLQEISYAWTSGKGSNLPV